MDELQRAAAQRWEELVKNGMHEDSATAETQAWLEAQRAQARPSPNVEVANAMHPNGAPSFGEAANAVRGGLGAVASGFTSSFSDEYMASARSLPAAFTPGGETYPEAFDRNMEASRVRRDEFREDHPIVNAGAYMAGAVAQGYVLAASAPLKLGAFLQSKRGLGAISAVEGAVSAAGMEDGGLNERLEAMPMGAAAGVTAALTGFGLGSLGRKAMDMAGIRPRTGGGIVDDVTTRADQRLTGALGDDDALGAAQAQIAGSSRPLMPIDVDPGAAEMARSVRSASAQARAQLDNILPARTAGQDLRILDQAFELATPPGATQRSLGDMTKDVANRRAADAAANYGPIKNIQIDDPRIAGFLQRPTFRAAWRKASKLAEETGGEALPPLSTLIDADGNLTGPIALGRLDEVKRAIDGVLQVRRAQRGLDSATDNAIVTARQQFVDILDKLVPEYKKARSAFAGDSALLDASELGQRLFVGKESPEEMAALFEQLGESEREFFVRGAFSDLRERIGRVTSNRDLTKSNPLSNSPNNLARLRILFPDDEAFATFQRGLGEEALMAQTQRFITGGSQTFDKATAFAEFAGVDLADMASLMRGDVGNVGARFAQRAMTGLRNRELRQTADELLPMLTATGDDAATVLDQVIRLRQGVGRSLSIQDAAIAVGAGSAGAAVAAPDRRERRQ